MTSLEDVAALASVSTATVSRVLSRSTHPVAEHTRQRVLAAARSIDFEPNLLASALARNRTQVIAVIVHDVMDEYFSEIARGIEDEAYANGYVTLVCNTDRDPDKEILYLRKLRAMQVDAILFTAGALQSRAHGVEVDRQLAQIERAGGAIVWLAPRPRSQPDVGYSNRAGLSLAVDHLVDLGHTTIGFLAGPPKISTSVERLSAMHSAMDRHQLTLDPALIFDAGFTRDGGAAAAALFADANLPATAFVAANDQAAIGFVSGLRSLSISVPGQVSVVGYDDIQPCAYVEPPLTTVHVPLYDIGGRGMRLALDLLEGRPRPGPTVVPLELTIRSSTAPPHHLTTTKPATGA